MKLKYFSIAALSAASTLGVYNLIKNKNENFSLSTNSLNEIIPITLTESNSFTAFSKQDVIGETSESLSGALATTSGGDLSDDDLLSFINSHTGVYIDSVDDYLYYQSTSNEIVDNDDFRNYFKIDYDLDTFLDSIRNCYVHVYLSSDSGEYDFLCKLGSINALYNYHTIASGNNYSIDSWLKIDSTSIKISSTRLIYVEYLGNEYVPGNNYYYYVDVDRPVAFNTIKASIRAIDETDGDISDSIQYTHTYPTDLSTLQVKEYPVVGVATDSSGNSKEFTFIISVSDNTKPEITVTSHTINNKATRLTTENIKTIAAISDNYYSNSDLTINVTDLDNYESAQTKAGNYRFRINVSDPSGNSVEKIFTLTVTDSTAPVFKSVDNSQLNLSGGTITTRLSAGGSFDYNYIKGLLKATDETDGDITASIEVDRVNSTYIGKENTASKTPYTLIFKVADKAGNTSSVSLSIYVQDDIPPIIYFNGNIYVTNQTAVTVDELSNFFLQSNNLSDKAYMTALSSNYFGNETKVGKYESTCTIYSLDSKEKVLDYTFDIIVLNDDGTIKEEDLAPKKEKWYQKIGDFFKKIGNFFVKIAKKIIHFFKKIF